MVQNYPHAEYADAYAKQARCWAEQASACGVGTEEAEYAARYAAEAEEAARKAEEATKAGDLATASECRRQAASAATAAKGEAENARRAADPSDNPFASGELVLVVAPGDLEGGA